MIETSVMKELKMKDSHLPKKCVIYFTESTFKIINHASCSILKALFVLKIFKCLSRIFGHAEKRLDSKDKVNFKIHDVTTWLTNNCNTHRT